MKQKTIGINPLEEYLSSSREQKEVSSMPEKSKDQAQETIKEEHSVVASQSALEAASLAGKQRITLHISADVVDRVKNAVYWEPGLTLAGFAEEALEKALKDLEAERGAPFPQRREHRLRGGRPII